MKGCDRSATVETDGLRMAMVRLLKIGVVWLLTLSALATMTGLAIDAPHLFRLRRQRAETPGTVTRKLLDGRAGVEVSYLARGRTYRRAFSPDNNNGQIAQGDPVCVYYLPDNPAIAFIAPPENILRDHVPAWAVSSMLGSLGLTAMLLLLAKRFSGLLRRVRGLPG